MYIVAKFCLGRDQSKTVQKVFFWYILENLLKDERPTNNTVQKQQNFQWIQD